MHYQLPYDSDAFRFAVPAPAIAAAGEGAARTFSGLAYSGEVIRNHDPWSALVLDLDGCELPPVLPVLLGHDRDRRVGLCTLAVREGVLWAEGRLLANPEAAALAADADAGFPWQLSVHAVPHHSDEIATAWGWPPSEMDQMGLAELMDWEHRAEAVLKARGAGI